MTRGDGAINVRRLSLAADDPFGTDLDDIELSVRGGEIVGIAGVAGNGQQELIAALSGERPSPKPARIVSDGTARAAVSTRPAARAGAAPSYRKSVWDAARCRGCRWPTTRC